jgi:tetratricopeptide (TPR) repeat protein
MTLYNKVNNITGWIIFLIATTVYWMTAEPTGSFWDCGEFIGCAYKLQVAHSPGAPLFIMVGHMFTLLAGDPSNVALMVNYMSGLFSSLTILFLFWTVTSFAKKIVNKKENEIFGADLIAIIGAGVVGALSYTFADSFWFSAVEGEVYAMSSFFTAIVFWSILKWENVADQPNADRWIVFGGYLIGLSIGVHLLGLLAAPAMVFVYSFRKFKPTRWNVIKTGGVAVAILGFIQYGIIPGIPTLAAKLDILFVNDFGLPFNSGVLFLFALLAASVVFGLWYAVKKNNHILHTAILTVLYIMIGYSSYLMVVIRANANPSINMSAPKDPIALLSYLNREQYGERPLAYGHTFTAEPIAIDRESGEKRYYRGKDKYEFLDRKPILKYSPADEIPFPRVWDNDDPSHVRFYRNWLGLREGEKVTMGDNLNFFFTYQVGFMYMRYFLWNFSGRQDDVQGDGDIQHGNWITGFPFIDNAMLGDQQNLPYPLNENKGKNKFYLLPFILGLAGAVYHFRKSKLDAWVVMLLFFFTGLAIVIYLNQTPMQPRERDYAYAGSFYAYTIWMGLGVLALFDYIRRRMNPRNAALIASAACVLVPVMMGAKGWDDHDRSNRTTARDFGRDYLESCAPNAILFTQGDNDTYPLWYAQEVEGIREDIRIVNLSLLGVDWYIDNLRRKINKSEAVIISVDSLKYRGSNRDYVRFYENKAIAQSQAYSLNTILDFMFNDDPRNKIDYGAGSPMNYLPARNIFIPVDKNLVLANNVVQPSDTAKILSRLEWKLNKGTLLKNDIMTMEILRSNLWKRPIYFAISVSPESYLGLNNYLQQEGLTYRVVPYNVVSDDGLPGGVQTDLMYENMMNKFAWGGVDKYPVYLDENILRMVTNLRSNFARLASGLIKEGKNEKAIEVLDKCAEVLPEKQVPVSFLNLALAKAYFEAGALDKGSSMLDRLLTVYSDKLRYYSSLPVDKRKYFTSDINEGVYVLNEITELSDKNSQADLNKKAQEAFQRYMNLYTPQNK